MPNPAEEVIAFIRTNQVGCAFAMHIAKDPDGEGLRAIIVNTPTDSITLKSLIGALLDDEPLIAAAIFPAVQEPDDLMALLRALVQLEDWRLEPVDVEDESITGLALRWAMPDGEHESWVLGFAPFDSMPNTRKAPHMTIILKAEPTEQPFLKREPQENGLRAIHLADLPFEGPVKNFADTWRATNRHRQRSLAGEKTRAARARVTFSLPAEYAEQVLELAEY